MLKAAGLSLALALIATTGAYAKDDDDAKVPAAEVEKVEATLSTLGCKGYEGLKKEEQGIYEIDDAKCAMGTVDIKLDKDYTVILDLPLLTDVRRRIARRSDVATKRRAGAGPARLFCANTRSGKCRRPLCRALPSCARLRSCPSTSLISGQRD